MYMYEMDMYENNVFKRVNVGYQGDLVITQLFIADSVVLSNIDNDTN